MKSTFYLDMDGVVADWDLAASLFFNKPQGEADPVTHHKNTHNEWIRLKTARPRFFRTLPLMQDVDQLVELARTYRDKLGWELLFLTAVPMHDDVPWAFYDKVMWAQDQFPDIPVHFGPHSTDKHNHCSPGDILVDDRFDNCKSWSEAGGISFRVLHNTLQSVLPNIRQDLEKRLLDISNN
jgi:hypothetical protein